MEASTSIPVFILSMRKTLVNSNSALFLYEKSRIVHCQNVSMLFYGVSDMVNLGSTL
jgi:hypothetical protein